MKLDSRKTFFRCCMVLACLFGPSAMADDTPTMTIQVTGTVERLSDHQLAAQLASTMAADNVQWRFVPDGAPNTAAPNRLVWSFKMTHLVWPGGSHKGFPGPSVSANCLSAEVKLFLNSDYQTTLRTDPMICNRTEEALERMAHDAVQILRREQPAS